ncbi:MAG: D-glycerate dehydrogenase [Sandaracinaceae bacterium]|nr:D-glycerate dehydrogenase [Sandaracinaceae bacterium]
MKILVTADFTDEGLALLARHGEVIHEPWSATGALHMAEELAELVRERAIDALVVEVDLVHEEVFEARPLRAVGCCRGEPINVDVDAATEHGVPVVFAPGRNARSVAELTVAFILNLARGVVPMHARLTSGGFDPADLSSLIAALGAARGFELGSATVGLLGLGAVGRETATRLRGFGCRLVAYDPHVADAVFEAHGVGRVELDALFARSDVLSLHASVTPQTRKIVSAARIASMKDGAFFVNTARHQLVDADALLDALRSGKLAGAGLDVFAAEPPLPSDPFLALDNVVCTPHIGGATRDVVRHQTRMVASDLDRILRGEAPERCANPEVLG